MPHKFRQSPVLADGGRNFESARKGIHAADVRVKQILRLKTLSPHFGVEIHAARGQAARVQNGKHALRCQVDVGWKLVRVPAQKQIAGIGINGAERTGGVNFDAKVRRESFEPIDLFYAHIGGMDAFARGLKIAAALRADGRLAEFVRQRYSSWDSGIGKEIEAGRSHFEALEKYMLKKGEPSPNESGRQEFLENLINEFI